MIRSQLEPLGIEPRKFVMFALTPFLVLAAVCAAAVYLQGALPGGWLVNGAAALLAFIFIAGAPLAWPHFEVTRRQRQIEDALPMFITHFGVLSTSNLPRTEIIKKLSEKKEYKALSRELGHLHSLVVNWHLSLPDAARQVGRRTPSPLFSDLLDRLAYALETGQDLEDFLRREQSVVLREYIAIYENSLYRIEDWKDLYMSAVMSGAFFAIFASIMPLLVGGDPSTLLIGVLLLTILLELLLMTLLQARLPVDRLFHRVDIPTTESRLHNATLQAGAPLALIAGFGAYFLDLRVGWIFACVATPLAVAGLLSQLEERRVKRREENYPAFIRSLGAAVEARGGSVKEILAHVKRHNFGPLSTLVDRLHARLHWRIDDDRAWKHFSAESGSDAIDNFTAMFVEGTKSGGKPAAIGAMISRNMTGILGLRTGRYNAAASFRSLVFSLTGAMAFVMFIGVGVLDNMGNIFSQADPGTTQLLGLGLDFSYNQRRVSDLVTGIMIGHSVIAALLIKLMDGGRFTGGLLHFWFMVLLSALIGYGAQTLMPRVFSFGGI